MASGKSAVGRELSRMTGRPLLDVDERIVHRAGKPIDGIFRDSGEAAFRALERSVVSEVCSRTGNVVATGGGAFVDEENRRRLLAGGLVVCLSARPETIHCRIVGPGPDPSRAGEPGDGPPVRPLLAGGDPLERIKSLLAQREEAYAQAHHTVVTDGLTPRQVASHIMTLLKQ